MRNLFNYFIAVAILQLTAVSLYAQVTTSSLSGKVTEVGGVPVAGATVVATHTPSGSIYYTMTGENGTYRIQNMRPGGPYKIEVSLLGFGSNTAKGIELTLAENYVHNVEMSEAAISLNEVVVSADGAQSSMRSERAGATTSLNIAQMNAIPTIARDLNGLVKLTPQAYNSSSGPQIGGGTYRENNFTIDGAGMNNSFGIGESMPSKGSPVSIDALDQISINVTPFDVRQSGFLGGAMNATTRSGSNRFEGSAYMYYYNENFRGKRTVNGDLTLNEETNLIYGARVGGPVIKDKLFFFLSAEFEKSTQPGPSRVASNGTNYTDGSDGIARPDAKVMDALSSYLSKNYGYSTGAYQGYSDKSPGFKVLARIDWNISKNHKLNFRYNITKRKDPATMSTSTSGLEDRYYLTGNRTNMSALAYRNSGYFQEYNFSSFAGELNSRFFNGTLSNILRVTYSNQNEPRSTNGGELPFVDIGVDKKYYTSFGTELFSYGNLREVKTLTVTDELAYTWGKNFLTFGIQYEHSKTKNGFQRFGSGYYTYNFDTEADLYNSINDGTVFNNPYQYAITHSFKDDYSQAFPEFKFNQVSLYLQDEVTVSDNFKIMGGIRFEMPSYPSLNTYNSAVFEAILADYKGNEGHYNTSQLPSTKLMISPRIGFNWDILGNRKVVLRGGSGFFTGRLPFVWIVAQAGDSNVLQSTYTAVSGNKVGKVVPDFSANRLDALKQIYPNGPGQSAAALPGSVSLMAHDLKMPQTWKSSLGVDVKLPFDIVGSLEAIYNYDVNPVTITNVGIKEGVATAIANYPDNRLFYGQYYNKTLQNAYLLHNADKKGDYFSLTAKLEKTYWKGLYAMIAYTYSTARSLGDGYGDQMYSAWMNSATINGNNLEVLGTPGYVMPHRLIANVSYGISYGKHFRTSASIFYEGGPAGRTSYTYTSNVVGDGGAANLIYVPASKDELKFANYTYTDEKNVKQTYTAAAQAEDFWNFVNNNKYLSNNKGGYAKRNGLTYPWVNQFDVKIMQDFYLTTRGGIKNTLQIGLDIKNIGNLFNRNWGAKQSYTVNQILKQTNKLSQGGTTVPVYNFQRYGTEVLRNAFVPTFGTSSTYLMQLTVRYIFN